MQLVFVGWPCLLCFETHTYSILIVLLHGNILQQNYMCRVDLSGNDIEQVDREPQSLEKFVLQPLRQSAYWMLRNSETFVLLAC